MSEETTHRALRAQVQELLRDNLPSSRLTNANRPMLRGPLGLMEQVFCANCGRYGGLVTKDWAEWVFYLCQPCGQRHGDIPLPEIPDEIVRGEYEKL
jgi:hypothetical protein